MEKIICILMTTFVGITAVFAQTITLTFTGRDADNHFVPFNRVEITNVTRNWQETLYYPDSILIMNKTGIGENAIPKGFALAQNNPNPFEVTTRATLTTSEAGEVTMEMLDMNGRMVASQKFGEIQAGVHQFVLTVAAPGTYILTARQNGKTSSIKMVNKGEGAMNRVEYAGVSGILQRKSDPKGSISKPFNIGDEMIYVGYVNTNGMEHSSQTIQKKQWVSENFVLNFNLTDGQPCPGTPTVTDYDGNVYNTVQIGTQCWMKENLRTTHYANGMSIDDGDTLSSSNYPYYYNYSTSSIALSQRGYLYNWSAATRGYSSSSNPSGVQGVCPTGWHVPSNAEWTQLSDYVGSRSQNVCGGNTEYLGKAFASKTGWNTSDNACAVGNNQSTNNATGFTGVPAGGCTGSSFGDAGTYAYFWSSSKYNNSQNLKSIRYLYYDYVFLYEIYSFAFPGYSVRCLRDN
ncbi:MAG: T9SS type A sorting domain-containing protein [Bacteroidales bacterium]|nr:T9SS type A sorting domain-containing protein [Bacteroidales bacterium]